MGRTTRHLLAAAVLVVFFLGGGLLLRRGLTPGTAPDARSTRLFDQVMTHVRRFSVDSLDESDLYRKAASGILAQLPDPYAALMVGSEQSALAEQTTGNYGGIGVQADLRGGTIMVVSAWPDSPADRAGIRTGDRIVGVDDRMVGPDDLTETAQLLRGTPGTSVVVRVRRPTIEGLLTFTVRRAEVQRRSVSPGLLYGDGIGYVALSRVAPQTAEELEAVVDSLQRAGMRSLVLDLRGNPGGLLEEGVEVADLFLDKGQPVLETRGRTASVQRQYTDDAPQRWPDLPITVLVNEGTASAAEIIAGALQDHDRALVIGQPTYGKGLVQSVFTLEDGAALRLTTGRWFTPSGRTIQRPERATGVLAAAAEPDSLPAFRTGSGRLVRGGGGITPDIIVRRDSLPAGERAFLDGMGSRLPAYRDAVTTVALRIRGREVISSPAFAVTPAMRQELLTELAAREIVIPDAQRQDAMTVIDRDLGHEVARYALGRSAELQRRAQYDKQLQAAFRALRAAPTPLALMGLGGAER